MLSNKKINIHKFITTIYNPNLNEFMVPIPDDFGMGHIVYEGRTIYRKDLHHLSSEGVFLSQFRDDLFHRGASSPSDFCVDYDSFLSLLEPLYNFYLRDRVSYISRKIEKVFRSTDLMLETDYFSAKLSENKKESKQEDFTLQSPEPLAHRQMEQGIPLPNVTETNFLQPIEVMKHEEFRKIYDFTHPLDDSTPRRSILNSIKWYAMISLVIKKVIILVAFLSFTFITLIPVMFNLTVLTMKNTMSILYTFAPNDLTLYIIIILSYPMFWLFISYKITRGSCKKKYHLILIVISLVNWWVFFMLARAYAWTNIFHQYFKLMNFEYLGFGL